jgi:dynein heavy chain
MGKLDARRDPIRKKFQYIIEQEQDITIMSGGLTEDDKLKLNGLDEAWNKFREGLEEANQIIQRSYQQLKTEMDHTIDDFKKEVQENKKNFQQHAPYAVDKNMDNSKAREKLQEFRMATKELREKEEDMKFGLDIFDIEPMAYPELNLVEKEMAQLFEIWAVKEGWDGEWDSWKDITFYQLRIDDMDDRAVEFQEKIKTFDKEVRQWGVYEYLKNKIDQFRTAMPLIADLRDEAMRERHWKELKFEVKEEFDENSIEFSLEKIFELGLNNHGEKVSELADNARKELKIEIQLEEIRRMWEDDPMTDLDIKQLKSKAANEEYYKIMSTENLYQVIEDHVVKLSNMKSSPYYKQFDDKIDTWENNIA